MSRWIILKPLSTTLIVSYQKKKKTTLIVCKWSIFNYLTKLILLFSKNIKRNLDLIKIYKFIKVVIIKGSFLTIIVKCIGLKIIFFPFFTFFFLGWGRGGKDWALVWKKLQNAIFRLVHGRLDRLVEHVSAVPIVRLVSWNPI